MSKVLDIYNSIANMEVGSIKCRDIDKIKLTVRDGDLPLRLLMPDTQGDMSFVMIGNLQNVKWVIRDLCLWANVNKGGGIADYSKSIMEYLSLYLTQLKANKSPVAQTVISGMASQIIRVKWGEQTYWGVDSTLTVEEII